MVSFWGNSSKIPHCNNTIMPTIAKTVPQWCPKLCQGRAYYFDVFSWTHNSSKLVFALGTSHESICSDFLQIFPFDLSAFFKNSFNEGLGFMKRSSIVNIWPSLVSLWWPTNISNFLAQFFFETRSVVHAFFKFITRFHETLKVTSSLPFSTHAFWRSLCISYRSVDNSIR